MTAPDTRADLAAQRRYVPLMVSNSFDGCRLSFGGGETVADFKTAYAALLAQRAAEIATADVLARVFR
jgi:hypothetical protein